MQKTPLIAAIVLCSGLLSVSAQATDYPIKVDCPTWSADAVAQVEARVRTTLLVEQLAARQISIGCAPSDAVSVSVESEYGSLVRPVVRHAERIEDDVVSAVEAALRELIPLTSEPASQPTPPAPPAPAPPAPVVVPAPAPPAPVPKPQTKQPTANLTELSVTAAGELWGSTTALGGDVGLSVGSERLRYGLAFSGRAGVNEPKTFDLQEWAASARLAFTLPQPSGLRFTAGFGASLLATLPAAQVVTASSSLLSTASFDAKVSRPFWLGPLALSPELGVRLFSARRNVLVDSREQVALPEVVPQLALSVIYRR